MAVAIFIIAVAIFTFLVLKNSARSLWPFPPAPIPATFRVSLGATNPLPKTCLGTIKKPVAASEEF